MGTKQKYNNVLVSGRKDETLTYSKYVKDSDTGISVKESIDLLMKLVKAATGLPEDLIEEMSYLYKKINELQAISENDINKIVDGSYVIDDEETVPITEYIKKQINILTKALEKNEKDDAYTRLRLESFIDSRLTPDQVNEALNDE